MQFADPLLCIMGFLYGATEAMQLISVEINSLFLRRGPREQA